MKKLTVFLICLPVFANTYYVSNSGSDSNAGTNAGTPWKTLAKVNATPFSPGDSILLNRGDIWREELTPQSSGAPGNQITISAYGTGANPVVSGANAVTQWTGGSGPVASASTCIAPCLFSSGMETAGFSDWSQVYTPALDGTTLTQSTNPVHSGLYSAQLKGGGTDNRAGLIENFPAVGSEGSVYFRFYLYAPSGALKANDEMVFFQLLPGGSNITLYTDGNGHIAGLQFYSSGGTIIPWDTSIPFVTGAWNYIDVAFKVGTSDGGGQVWVNGTSIGSKYNLNTTGSLGVNQVTIGNTSYGHGQVAGGSLYLDDFEIATSGPIGPTLSLATALSTRADLPTGVWSAAVPVQPNVVFIAGNLGVQELTQSAVTAPGEWSWSAGTLYVYSASGAPANVEAAQREYALLIGGAGYGSYTTISGIDFRIANADVVHIVNTSGDVLNGGLITGGYQFGVLAIGVSGGSIKNLMISNNTVSLNGGSGIEISSGHSYVTIQGNTTFGNAFNSSFLGDFIEIGGINLLGVIGFPEYDLVQYNVSDHNGVVGGNESQGSGIWFDSVTSSTMQGNLSFDNTAFGLYFEKTNNCLLSGNYAYSNSSAPNTSNIAVYASQGLPSVGNTITGNVAWNSQNWGMKLGAYQGAGATQVYDNTYTNNTVVNSQSLDLFADTGADNDGVNGHGNQYSYNAFGTPGSYWIYWVSYGLISSYAQLDSAYGSPMNNVQSGWTVPVGAQKPCTGTCLFTTGMETAGFSDWSGIYLPSSDGTKVAQTGSLSNSGSYALQLTGGGQDNRGGLTKALPVLGANGTLYFRFYINIPPGALTANDQFQIFQIPTGAANVLLGTDSNGSVNSLEFTSGSGLILATTPVSFPMGTWNYIDVAFKSGSGSGGGQLWLNGVNLGGSYSLNTSASAAANSAILGNTSQGHGQAPGGNIYLDDFRIATVGPIGAAPLTLPVQAP